MKFNKDLKDSTVSASNVKLFEINTGTWGNGTEVDLSNSGGGYDVSLLDTDKSVLVVTLGSNLTSSTLYRFIAGEGGTQITDTEGLPLEWPIWLEFTTGSGADSTKPTVQWVDYTKDGSNEVPTGLQSIFVGMSESVDPSTLTSNTIDLWIDKGASADDGVLDSDELSTKISLKFDYDPYANIINIKPQQVLTAESVYTLALRAGVSDAASNTLTQVTYTFTTQAADSVKPKLDSVYADNFGIWLQFSEPMKQSTVTTSSNYTITVAQPQTDPGYTWSSSWSTQLDNAGTALNIMNASFYYDEWANGVWMDGIIINSGDLFRVTLDTTKVTDVAGNVIDSTSTDTDNTDPHPNALKYNVFEGMVFQEQKDETAPKLLRVERMGNDIIEIVFDEPSGLQSNAKSGGVIGLNSDVIQVDTGGGYQTLAAAGITAVTGLVNPNVMWDRIQIILPMSLQGENFSGTIRFTGLQDNEGNELTATSSGGSADNEVTFAAFNSDELNKFDDGEFPHVMFTTPMRYMVEVPTNATTVQLGFNKKMQKDPDNTNSKYAQSVLNPVNVLIERNISGTWTTLEGGGQAEGALTRSYDSDTNTLSVTTANALQGSSHYRVTIKGDITDIKDRPIGWDDIWEFWTASGSDSAAPTVSWVNMPTNSQGMVNVMVPMIEIFMSEDIDGSLVQTDNAGSATSNVNIAYQAGKSKSYVSGMVEYDPFSYVIRFFPKDSFKANMTYKLQISNDVADKAGNTLASQYEYEFTTAEADTSNPKVTWADMIIETSDALTSIGSTTDITSTGAKIFIQFDKAMKITDVEDLNNYTITKGSTTSAITTAVDLTGSQIEYHQDHNGVEIWGGAILVDEGDYFKIVVATTVKDMGDNVIDTNTDSDQYSPRDIDSVSNTFNEWEGQVFNPMVFVENLYAEEVSPNWGAQNIPINATSLLMKFNKDIKSSTLTTSNIKIYEINTSTWANDTEVTLTSSDISLLSDKRTVVVTPQLGGSGGNFSASTQYRFIVGEGGTQITDTDGIPLQWPIFLEFTTAGVADNTDPAVEWVEYEKDGSNNVPTGLQNIFIKMSESIDPATLTSSNISLWIDKGASADDTILDNDEITTEISMQFEYDPYANKINLKPKEVLTASSDYTLILDTGITDVAGNTLTKVSYTFTSQAADSVKPKLESVYADNFGIWMQFSEPMNETSVTTSANFEIKVAQPTSATEFNWVSGWTTQIDSAGVDLNLKNANFYYDEWANGLWMDGVILNSGDLFRVTLNSTNVKDLSGNAIDSTTTDSDDTDPHPNSLKYNVFEGKVFQEYKDETPPKLLRIERMGKDMLEIVFDEPEGIQKFSSTGGVITINSSVIEVDTGGGYQTLSAAGITVDPEVMWDRVQIFLPASLEGENFSGNIRFTGLQDNEGNVLTATSNGGSADNIIAFSAFDTAALNKFDDGEFPHIMFSSPFPYMVDVPTNANTIQFGFNKQMVDDTDNSNSKYAQSVVNPVNVLIERNITGTWTTLEGGGQAEGAVTRAYDSDTNVLNITTANALQGSSHYRVTTKGDMTDLKDRAIGWDDVWEFWTASGNDSTAPTVSWVNMPTDANGFTQVMIPMIEVFLSEDVDGSTVNAKNAGSAESTVNIVYQAGKNKKYVSGEVEYDPHAFAIKFFPKDSFKANMTYKLQISNDLKDLAGNTLAAAYTYEFTTAEADTSNPKVTWAEIRLETEAALNKFDDTVTTESSAGSKIFIQFDKAMDSNEVEDLSNYTITKGTAAETITTSVDLTGANIQYHPDFNGVEIWGGTMSFLSGDFFKIAIASTVTDMGGNIMDVATDSDQYSPRNINSVNNPYNEWEGEVFNPFTFFEPLFLIDVYPNWGDFSVPPNAQKYMAKFNRKLKKSTVTTSNVKLYEINTTTWAEGNEATLSTVTLLDDQETIYMEANSALTADTEYRLIIGIDGQSQITDLDGIPLDYPIYVDFKTASANDTTDPTVSWTSVENGDTNVSASLQSIIVGMSEGIDPSTMNNTNIRLWIDKGASADDGIPDNDELSTEVSLKFKYDPYSYIIDIQPQEVLTVNSVYTLRLDTNVTDTVARGLAANNTLSFTTEAAADSTAPQVLQAYADTFGIFLQFNEPMKESTVTSKSNYTIIMAPPIPRDSNGTSLIYDSDNNLITTDTGQLTNNGSAFSLNNAEIGYDRYADGAWIDGLKLPPNNIYRITLSQNVKDVAGNAVSTATDTDGVGPHPDNIAYNVFEGTIFSADGFDEPPHVMHSFPAPGDNSVPPNIDRVKVGFSENIDPDTLTATTFYVAPVSSDGSTGTAIAVAPTYNQETNEAEIVLSSSLTAGTKYRLIVTTGIEDAGGNSLMSIDPQNPTGNAWESEFKTEAANDTTAPEIWGTGLHEFENTAGNIVDVPTSLGAVKIMFSENMRETLIRDMDASDAGSNIYVELNSNNAKVAGKVKYDPEERVAKWIADAILTNNVAYNLIVTTSVQDSAGNAIVQYTLPFTTRALADTKKPFIGFAEAENSEIRIIFNEAIKEKHAKNKKNYTIQSPIGVKKNLEKSEIEYISEENLVIIRLDKINKLESDATFLVQVNDKANTFEDLAGNDIETNADTQGTDDVTGGTSASIDYDPEAYRDLGTSGRTASVNDTKFNEFEGYVFTYYDEHAANLTAAAGMTDAQKEFDAFNDAMTAAFIHPWREMAGETSRYDVGFTATKAIASGATIKIKFPEGFDVSSASAVAAYSEASPDESASWANKDISPDVTTAITIASVAGNKSNRTITITTAGGASYGSDAPHFIHFELDNIVNSSIPKEFGTDGYKAEIKTVGTDNKRIEGPIKTEPWFLSKRGSGQISGTVTAKDKDDGAVGAVDSVSSKIFLDSPQSGFIEQTLTFSSGAATYSFPNLPDGEYQVWMEGISTLVLKDYQAPPMVKFHIKSGSNTKVYNFDIKDTSESVTDMFGTVVTTADTTIAVTGGPVSKKVYIHVGNMEGGMIEKELTLDGSGAGSSTFKRPQGFYFASVDPTPMKSNGMIEFSSANVSFIPPQKVGIEVNGVKDGDETAVDTLTFNLTSLSTDQYLDVTVKDTNNNLISGAKIKVRNPDGIDLPVTETGTDGVASFKLPIGDYTVGGHVPGLPPLEEEGIEITTSHSSSSQATIEFVVTVAENKISGKVLQGTNTVSGAGVFAQEVTSKTDSTLKSGNLFTMTDENGAYSLYIPNSTVWKISAYVDGYGDTDSVTIDPANDTTENVNLSVSSSLIEINGIFTFNGTAVTDAMIFADSIDSNGDFTGNFFNEAKVDSTGAFTLRVKASADISNDTYKIVAFSPTVGEKVLDASYTVADAGSDGVADATFGTAGTVNIVQDLVTVTVSLKDSSAAAYTTSEAFVDFTSSTDEGSFMNITNASSGTIKLPAGTYTVSSYIEEVGELSDQTMIVSTSNTALDLTISTSSVNITGTIKNISGGAVLSSAYIKAVNATTGFEASAKSGTDGTFTVSVPQNATYSLVAMKADFMNSTPQDVVITTENKAVGEITLEATATSGTKITGTLQAGSAAIADSVDVVIWAIDSSKKMVKGKRTSSGASYEIYVGSGTWTVYAKTEGYEYTASATDTVASSDITHNIDMTAIASYTATESKIKSITPSNGGKIEDPPMPTQSFWPH